MVQNRPREPAGRHERDHVGDVAELEDRVRHEEHGQERDGAARDGAGAPQRDRRKSSPKNRPGMKRTKSATAGGVEMLSATSASALMEKRPSLGEREQDCEQEGCSPRLHALNLLSDGIDSDLSPAAR